MIKIPYKDKKFIDLEHMKKSACGPLPCSDRPYKDYHDYINITSKRISKQLKICNTDTVLDIGSGLGDIAIQLSKTADKIHCCDINAEYLESATKNCRKYKNIFLHPISDIDLPLKFLPNNCIDKAYEQLVFIHNDVEIIVNYLKELKRTLKPNGLFRFRFCIEKLNKNIDIIECNERYIKENLQKLNYKIIQYGEDWPKVNPNRGINILISKQGS